MRPHEEKLINDCVESCSFKIFNTLRLLDDAARNQGDGPLKQNNKFMLKALIHGRVSERLEELEK